MTRRPSLVLLCVALGCFACSSEERPDVSRGGGISPPGALGGSGRADRGDAGGDGPIDLCDPTSFEAVRSEPVTELLIHADTPPEPIGGEVSPGTYVLVEVNRFARGGGGRDDETGEGGEATSPSALVRKSLVIEGDTYRLVEAEGEGISGPETVSGGRLRVEGATLVLTESCPGSSSKDVGFTAVATSLALYPASDRRETYVRR